jgi:CheY-like chemotaxis protein
MAPHIMVLNHSPALLAFFQELLESEGYRVTADPFTHRSVEAVALAQPQLLLCDYPAILEQQAWQFLQALKATPATAALPLLVCTTSTTLWRDHGAWLLQHDIAVLAAPFELDVFFALLAQRLDAGAAASNTPSMYGSW